MCSVFGLFDFADDPNTLREQALALSKLQRHRGPDWTGVHTDADAALVHERLAIVGIQHGAQPLKSTDSKVLLAANAEIYNHESLENDLPTPYDFRTDSDCEVILPLYQQTGVNFLNEISGIFAFVLWDRRRKRYLVARDPIGVNPLYYGRDEKGQLYVASEMKAIAGVCSEFDDFPPGCYLDGRKGEPSEPVRYYQPPWRDYATSRGKAVDLTLLRTSLEQAVERQLMSDVPHGVLLSGGLDSSIITALAKRHKTTRIETRGRSEAWWPQVHSFSIGLDGSPDLAAARRVAEELETIHHEFHFTVQDGIDALSDVIYHLETFDVTTVRASTPMYLMARRIKSMGIKMILSGEGADEVFGGYLYFHKAPNAREFHAETVRKLDLLHKYDCLRANKSMAAWGVEARVPFLDRQFLDVAMGFDASEKMTGEGRMEKYVLREAFKGFLPEEILWRQKEQFSDGVGYSWIDSLRGHAEQMVSNGELAAAAERFPIGPPATKEAYLYRTLFARHFPSDAAARCVPHGDSIACSTPAALAWDTAFADRADPSGRSIRGVHQDSY